MANTSDPKTTSLYQRLKRQQNTNATEKDRNICKLPTSTTISMTQLLWKYIISHKYSIRFNVLFGKHQYRLATKSLNYSTVISASDVTSIISTNHSPTGPIISQNMTRLAAVLWDTVSRLWTRSNILKNIARIWTSRSTPLIKSKHSIAGTAFP